MQIIAFTSFDNSGSLLSLLLFFLIFHFHFLNFHFHFFTFEGGMQKVGGQIIAFTSLDNSLSALRSVPSPLTEPKAIIFCIYFKGRVSQFCFFQHPKGALNLTPPGDPSIQSNPIPSTYSKHYGATSARDGIIFPTLKEVKRSLHTQWALSGAFEAKSIRFFVVHDRVCILLLSIAAKSTKSSSIII